MNWAVAISLIPLAKELIKGISNLKLGSKKQEKVEKDLNKAILDLYNNQFDDTHRAIALISGWRPILARIQAIDITLRRWEFLAKLAYLNSDQEEALDSMKGLVDEKKIKILLKELDAVRKVMDKLQGETNLTWSEGGTSLWSALSNLEKELEDLADFLPIAKTPEDFWREVRIKTQDAQEETTSFFSFWDKVLAGLVVGHKQSREKFTDELDDTLKKQLKPITAEYTANSWDKILTDTLDEISQLDFGEKE